MNKIISFEKHYKYNNYDRIKNPKNLSIKDLLPIALSWAIEGKNFF